MSTQTRSERPAAGRTSASPCDPCRRQPGGAAAPHGQPRRAWASATAGPRSPRETAAPAPAGGALLAETVSARAAVRTWGRCPGRRTAGPGGPAHANRAPSRQAPGAADPLVPQAGAQEDPSLRTREGEAARRPVSGTERRHGPAAPKRGRTPPAQLSEPPLLKGTIRTRPVGRAPWTGRDQNKPSNLE